MAWEIVMGLEVHVELSTKTKIFCSCTTEFGGSPNTHCCPVCTGMPGTLPVLNKKVLEYAVKAGTAFNCTINQNNKFDRKNYFYPDLPKAYQISQLYLPFAQDGHVDIVTRSGKEKTIRIHEIHMEEDAGKLIHSKIGEVSYPDYNRCGVPLIEIVSEPDFRSAEEVIAYLEKVRSTLKYLGVSDCKMQEGSLRADVNLSVHEIGTDFGTRTEMKNINSFKAIERAIEFEAKRQIQLLEKGEKIVQETRKWDDNKGKSFAMRSKENAQDYRYFPEPDIPPIYISDEYLEDIKNNQVELADERAKRYMNNYSFSEYDAKMMTIEKSISDIFEKTIAIYNNPKETCKWIMGSAAYLANEQSIPFEEIVINPENFAEFIEVMDKGIVNLYTGKRVFEKIFNNPERFDVNKYINDNGLAVINDDSEIINVVKEVIESNPKALEEFLSGKEKAFGFFMGQCMKKLKGKADPNTLTDIIKKELEAYKES